MHDNHIDWTGDDGVDDVYVHVVGILPCQLITSVPSPANSEGSAGDLETLAWGIR